ncbi:MAG: response regulator, partial [Bdellovibrionales bacterium]|nr:response regulator [Bdellovibrionales bacterium]
TFFFREYSHFEMLEKWIELELPRLKSRFESFGTPLRIWSAASSRGQEVYSLAMFLQHCLFKKLKIPFQIIGTDIDPTSIVYAKNGVYPISEVNTIPSVFLQGNWKRGTGKISSFAAVRDHLKSNVQFEVLNLLEIEQWKNQSFFDVIFCRNVLIYFSEDKVRQIALSLARRLDENGLLVSGMSEPIRFEGWPLMPLGSSCYLRDTGVKKAADISDPEPGVLAIKAEIESLVSKRKYRVLCVDDSPTIQKLMQKIFSQDKEFEKIEIAENGAEARKILDKESFDLITLDIHMPEVNGIEFLENFYRRTIDPPVVMVSSVNRTDIELASKSLSLGAFDYVEKPAMNNLAKSSEEILTKARMAIRSRAEQPKEELGSFDKSIAQKIVIPDASQCIRIILTSYASLSELGQIISGQRNEYRSPANIIFWPSEENRTELESKLLTWTDRKIIHIRDSDTIQVFRPNCSYIVVGRNRERILENLKAKSVSLQFLEFEKMVFPQFKVVTHCQILLDESLSSQIEEVENLTGVPVSDICPSISFSSLSAEYFAGLRKVVA